MTSADFVQLVEQQFGYEPTAEQHGALECFAAFMADRSDRSLMILRGSAGTGKTTLAGALIGVLGRLGVKTVLLAPTGRAAKVLSSYAGRPASTIHKHIYRQKSMGDDGFGSFSLAPNKAKDTLFVVDEVSLIGIEPGGGSTNFGSGNLLEDLVRFVRSGVDCRLVLIGDAAQLPPVGLDQSPALSDAFMAGFGGVHFSTLTTVVRQQKESGILWNATRLREMISEEPEMVTLPELELDVSRFEDIVRISGGELIEALTDAYGAYGEDEVVVHILAEPFGQGAQGGGREGVLLGPGKDHLVVIASRSQLAERADFRDDDGRVVDGEGTLLLPDAPVQQEGAHEQENDQQNGRRSDLDDDFLLHGPPLSE